MKKVFERIIEGILTCSGFVTSITILLIVLFLFTEAFGLFSSKVIEEGYVLALNKDNKVSELTPMQIKDVFDEEITNWKELGVKISRSGCSVWKTSRTTTRKKNWEKPTRMQGKRLWS